MDFTNAVRGDVQSLVLHKSKESDIILVASPMGELWRKLRRKSGKPFGNVAQR